MAKLPTLKELRITRSIPAREIVAVVRQLYPKFDAPTLSKVESTDYGTELPKDATKLVYQTFAPELVPLLTAPKPDPRRLTARISCRLEDDVHALLMEHIKAQGYATTQAWLENLIERELDHATNP